MFAPQATINLASLKSSAPCQLLAVDQVPRHPARLGADRPVELAPAQAVKEPPVHRTESEHPDGPRVAVRQNRLRPVLVADRCSRAAISSSASSSSRARSLVLLAPHQRPLCHSGFPSQRVQNPLRRVHTVQIFGYLAHRNPCVIGCEGSPCTLIARPLASTVTKTAQLSGQSCEQTVCTMRNGK